MSAATTPEQGTERSALRDFMWQRLGTILALAPLGIWVVIHIWNNLAAFDGAEAWETKVTHQPHPVAAAVTWTLVLVPLLLHTVWGLRRTTWSKPNNLHYGYFGNLRYVLQRLSALGVLLFIGAHLWLAFLQPRLLEGHPEHFHEIAHEMRHHGPTLLVYLLGTLGVSYHLANGIASSAMAFGVGTTARSQKRMERFALVAFAVLLAMMWSAVYALWRAGM